MTVEDIKSADTESLKEWFENGSWKSFPEDAQRDSTLQLLRHLGS